MTRATETHWSVLGALTMLLGLSAAGCGDGMVDFEGGPGQHQQQQASNESGRYVPPQSVQQAGARQQGNIRYDDADQCIGTGTPIHDGADRLARFLMDNFEGASRYDHTVYCRSVRGGSSLSMHATGRAIDLYVPTVNNDADNDAGDPIANYLIRNATELGVQYFIWDRTDWNTAKGYTEDYCQGRCWEHGGGKHPHHDHLHIELTKHAAHNASNFPAPVGGTSSDGGSNGGGSNGGTSAGIPTPQSPADGAQIWSDGVELEAGSVSGAQGYKFEIEYYTGNTWRDYITYTNRRAAKEFWPYMENTPYRWRVAAGTSSSWSDFSDWQAFRYGSAQLPDSNDSTDSSNSSNSSDSSDSSDSSNSSNSTNSSYSTLSPTGGEQIHTDGVTVSCDPVQGATRYQFEIERYDGSGRVSYYTYEPGSASKKFWPATDDAAYRWRVRARTSSGWKTYSGWNTFLFGHATNPAGTTGTNSGGTTTPTSNAPTGLSPNDGDQIWTDGVTLSSDSVAGASEYEFEIERHNGYRWESYYTYSPGSSAKKFWPAVNDSAYRWRVRAKTSSGWTDRSGWNTFLFGNARRP